MKRIVTIFVSVLLSVLSCSFVQAASYSDVSRSHWAYDAINYLSQMGAVEGYTDGSFRPSQSITRAEFSKIIVELLGSSATQNTSSVIFSDVSQFHWANEYVKKASFYLNANNKNRFYPDSSLLRQDAAVAMVNVAGKGNEKYDTKTLDKFTDKNLISEEYESYIALAVGYGLMNGNANGTFNPAGSVTRAEMCQIIYNVYLKSKEPKKTVTSTSGDDFVPYSGNIDVTFSPIQKTTQTNNGAQTSNGTQSLREVEPGVIYVTPINKTYSGPEISLDVKVEGGTLSDGGVYTIGKEEYILATIQNPSSTQNFIYYSFAYGTNYQETMVKKVDSYRAEITIPEELVGKRVKLSIWGTSRKDGVGYMTQTEILYFNYTNNLNHRGESYDEETYVKLSDKKVDFFVTFNGKTIEDGDVIDGVKLSQKIMVRAKPVNNMKSVNYRWDNTIEYTKVEGPTASIEFPESFTNGSTHKLTVTITDKEGRTYVPRVYRFVIGTKVATTETTTETTTGTQTIIKTETLIRTKS